MAMSSLLEQFNKEHGVSKNSSVLDLLRPGVTVRVHHKVKEGSKTRVQAYEGLIIARKHGSGTNATITVRKSSNGIGVERIFPIHLPSIEKFEIMKTSKVRRAKLYYIRTKSAKETRRKTKVIEAKSPATEVATQ